MTHQLRDAFFVATQEAVKRDGKVDFVHAGPAKLEEAEFMMLKDGLIIFEGTADELRASTDPYIQAFLVVDRLQGTPMPRTRSLKWSELKIGIMAVVALLIAAALILALGGEGGFFWQRYNLKVKFSNAGGVQQGSPVRVAGRHRRRRHGHRSSSGPKSRWSSSCTKTCRSGCRTTSRATIGSVSLLGEGAVDITRHHDGPADSRVGLCAVGSRRRAQLADVTAQANKGITELTALIQDVRAGKGTVGKLMTDEQLYAELRQFTAAAREVTEGLAAGQGHARTAAEQPGERATARGVAEEPDGHHRTKSTRARAASAS